ncbi:CYFIP-related Rac1 interactor B-like [Panonychus citri]|uniref:CYFIP-related Rac1 interactor B-like n=1 Tax=Panonychus citri TaxID=50023 RepID=UPI0023070DE4|nr:CYFIP-related Rac1 interactor B-like [Panonychus citri]
MGNLLRLLSRDEPPKYDVFVDFENAQPSESEKQIFQEVEMVLIKASDLLHQLQTYKGASNEIREAIANPQNDLIQMKAWQTVTPLVDKLKDFYLFSVHLESVIPKLLRALTSGPMTPQHHLETQQALVKQFAEILDFVLKFDDLKMSNPSIQNDFSYYRRTTSRISLPMDCNLTPGTLTYRQYHHDLSKELANRMSLFYANATPMLKVLSDVTSNYVISNKNVPMDNTTETLSTMAKVCQRMIENPEFCSRFQNGDTILFVLRVMVGVIILYDHVHPSGAFSKSSPIDIKGTIKVLRDQPSNVVEGLLNALRYTTKHLNDENTPKQIKALLV